MNDEAARQGRRATNRSPMPSRVAANIGGTRLRVRRVDLLAADVGRLRRRLDADTYDGFLAWRVAEHVDALAALLEPTAAELYRESGDIDAVLEHVDSRDRELRSLLGDRLAL